MDQQLLNLNERTKDNIVISIKYQYKIIENEMLLHEKSHIYFSNLYYYLNIVNLFLLSSSTVVNFINQVFTGSIIVNIIIIIFLFISSVFSSIIHFLKFEKNAEMHSTKANAYKSLLFSIKTYFISPKETAEDYFLWITKKCDELILTGPPVPIRIKNKYSKSHFEEHELDEIIIPQVVNIQEKQFEPESNEEKYQIDRWLKNYST